MLCDLGLILPRIFDYCITDLLTSAQFASVFKVLGNLEQNVDLFRVLFILNLKRGRNVRLY